MRHTRIFQDSVNALTFPNLSSLWFPVDQVLAATQPLALSDEQVSRDPGKPFKNKTNLGSNACSNITRTCCPRASKYIFRTVARGERKKKKR